MNTNKLENQIAERVVAELNKRGIKQNQLMLLCRGIGVDISQASISKIYSGKKKLNLLELIAISKVVEKSIDYFVWGNEYREDFCDPHDSEVLNDFGIEIQDYQGDFHFYYLSTAEGEDKILHGKLHVKEERGLYSFDLNLYTGERDSNNKQIVKLYEGRILITPKLGAAYFILKSELIGEVCMICLRHRSYTIKNVECRVGMALTVSAGEIKEPTAHRCLLVRKELGREKLEELRPWLYMVGDDIRIEKRKWEKLMEEKEMQSPQYIDEIKRVERSALHREYLELNVDMLRRQLSMGRHETLKFLSELYDISDKVKRYKISSNDDIRMYEMVTEIGREDAYEITDSG